MTSAENERRPIGAGGAQYIDGAVRTVAGPDDEGEGAMGAPSESGEDPNAVNSGAATAEPIHLLGDEDPDGRNGPRFYTARQIADMTPEGVAWVIEPWIATGCTTLLLGKAKAAGKTTFVLRLVAALLDGKEFLGHPTQKTPVVYLSEQSPESLQPALKNAGLLDRDDLLLLSYPHNWQRSWHDLVSAAVEECARLGAKLLVVDTFPEFAHLSGDNENSAGAVLGALKALKPAQRAGIAVLLVHHVRKSGGDPLDAGRGSTALTGAVDIISVLEPRPGNSPNAQRVIRTVSRFRGEAALVIELTDEGYVLLGAAQDVAAAALADEVEAILEDVSTSAALSFEDIHDRLQQVGRSTLQKILKDGEQAGRWHRRKEGKGYHYFGARADVDPVPSIHKPTPKETDEAGGGDG